MNACRYVCSTCHLRQQLQSQILSLQQARRGYSVSRTVRQQQHAHGDGPGRQSKTPTRPRYGQQNATTAEAARGRYSRQPLQPEQLLDELSQPASRDRYHSVRPQGPRLPSELQTTLKHFLAAREIGRNSVDVSWPLLQQLAASPDAKLLAKHREFIRAYQYLIMAVSKNLISGQVFESIAAAERPSRFVRPSDALSLHGHFEIDLGGSWARTLWRMSKNIIIMRARGLPEEAQRLYLDEVVKVWNLALRARLRRRAGESVTLDKSGHLDWSFLPPVHIFAEMLHGSRRGNARLYLEDGLQMLLPAFKSEVAAGPFGRKDVEEEAYDYASAAIVTLDALHLLSAQQHESDAGNTVGERYGQFVEVLETLFRVLPSAVPAAAKVYLNGTAEEGKKNEMRTIMKRVGVGALEEEVPRVKRESPRTLGAGPTTTTKKPASVKEVVDATRESPRMSVAGPATTTDPLRELSPVKEVEDAAKHESDVAKGHAETVHSTTMVSGQLCVVLYAHEAGDEGEMSVKEGQHVTLIDDEDGSGWINVRTKAVGDVLASEGFVPASYVEAVDESSPDAVQPELDSLRNTSELTPGETSFQAGTITTTDENTPRTQRTEQRNTISDKSVPPTDADEIADRFVNLRIKRLGQAMQKHSLTLAESIKREIFDFDSRSTSAPLRNQMYEHLLLALLALHSPSSALEVWKHFTQTLGRSPTAKTYTVMMQGAQHVRDVQGVERFWHEMRKAGVQPDVNAWTTRVFGLIRGGWVTEGLEAVEEMGRRWLIAAADEKQRMDGGSSGAHGSRRGRREVSRPNTLSTTEATQLFPGDINSVPRPSQFVMNAAISSLATRDDKQIPRVLAWGRSFGIKPDLTVYNTLLNISMRHGRFEEAESILTRMREEGIEMNGDTWTVLLTLVFERGQLDKLDPAAAQEKIMNLITSLEEGQGGKPLDPKSYALVIDRLLKGNEDRDAANAVLAHMLSKDVTPSPHIYTILMTSYLLPNPPSNTTGFNDEPQTQRPPDFDAASALWQHIQSANGGRGAPLDPIFYDRVIEAYALHSPTLGSTRELTYFLSHMRARGVRPGWRALELASRALAQAGEWPKVMKLVDLARQEGSGMGEGGFLVGKRNFGAREYWEWVVGTGMLREEGVVGVEQLMPGKRGVGGPLGREGERIRRVGR